MSLVSIVNKQYLEEKSIRNLVIYCLGDKDLQKRNYEVQWGGNGIMLHNPEAAVKSMMDMKSFHERTEGNQLCHIILTIFCKESNYISGKACAAALTEDVSGFIYKLGHQNCYFVHTDTNFLHIHLVINSLKPVTRQLITGYPWFMEDLLKFLVCDYGFLDWEKDIQNLK